LLQHIIVVISSKEDPLNQDDKLVTRYEGIGNKPPIAGTHYPCQPYTLLCTWSYIPFDASNEHVYYPTCYVWNHLYL